VIPCRESGQAAQPSNDSAFTSRLRTWIDGVALAANEQSSLLNGSQRWVQASWEALQTKTGRGMKGIKQADLEPTPLNVTSLIGVLTSMHKSLISLLDS